MVKKLLMLALCVFVVNFIACVGGAYGGYLGEPVVNSVVTGEYPNDHNMITIYPEDPSAPLVHLEGDKIFYTVNGKDPIIPTTPKVIVNPKLSKVIIKNPITGQPINQPSYTFEYTKPFDLYAYLPTSAFPQNASRYILKVIGQYENGDLSNIVTKRYTRYRLAKRPPRG